MPKNGYINSEIVTFNSIDGWKRREEKISYRSGERRGDKRVGKVEHPGVLDGHGIISYLLLLLSGGYEAEGGRVKYEIRLWKNVDLSIRYLSTREAEELLGLIEDSSNYNCFHMISYKNVSR